jgi:hypothetical protein
MTMNGATSLRPATLSRAGGAPICLIISSFTSYRVAFRSLHGVSRRAAFC